MSDEIQIFSGTGTIYFQIRTLTGTIWNTSTSALEVFSSGNWIHYANPMTSEGGGYYVGSMPLQIGSGNYPIVAFQQTGGWPASSDASIFVGEESWSGSSAITDSTYLQTSATTGSTVYCVIRNSALQIWNGTTFETFNNAHWATYCVFLTEQGVSGFFSVLFPALITTADTYVIEFYQGAGIETDQFIAGGNLVWNGSGITSNPLAGNLTSLSYVKSFMNINGGTWDVFLQNAINSASAEIQAWTNNQFILTNYQEVYDGNGSTILQLNQVPVNSVSNIVTHFNTPNPLTISGTNLILDSNNGFISILPWNNTFSTWFNYGFQNIQATYTAGYATIPADVQEATAKVVMNKFSIMMGQNCGQGGGGDMTLSNEKIGDYGYTRRPDALMTLPKEIQASLFRYRNIYI